jgi:hypothetical protein
MVFNLRVTAEIQFSFFDRGAFVVDSHGGEYDVERLRMIGVSAPYRNSSFVHLHRNIRDPNGVTFQAENHQSKNVIESDVINAGIV